MYVKKKRGGEMGALILMRQSKAVRTVRFDPFFRHEAINLRANDERNEITSSFQVVDFGTPGKH